MLVNALFGGLWITGAPGRGLTWGLAWTAILILIFGVIVGLFGGRIKERVEKMRLPQDRFEE